jgi:hypothetical protein
MIVDREWAPRNLGRRYLRTGEAFDAHRASSDGNHASAADRDQALRRDLIDFDSEREDLRAIAAADMPASASLAGFVDIQWPADVAPMPGSPPAGEALPRGDVLIVTWTADEGHALSRVLTPGYDSQRSWRPYRRNFDAIAEGMRPECPARSLGRLGTYWTAKIGKTPITLFKSDSHLSQDGPTLPGTEVWRQIIAETQPGWVITTGAGGGIGPEAEVGDVLVSRFAGFDCHRDFTALHGESFASEADPPPDRFGDAARLFSYNSKFLPPDNSRAPRIVVAPSASTGVVTTDYFGFDNTDDSYDLQGKGALSDMDDAVLGLVCRDLGSGAPEYVAVRNVIVPQIDSVGLTLREQTQLASHIYMGYGRWSTVCSAIVCWAIVAAL